MPCSSSSRARPTSTPRCSPARGPRGARRPGYSRRPGRLGVVLGSPGGQRHPLEPQPRPGRGFRVGGVRAAGRRVGRAGRRRAGGPGGLRAAVALVDRRARRRSGRSCGTPAACSRRSAYERVWARRACRAPSGSPARASTTPRTCCAAATTCRRSTSRGEGREHRVLSAAELADAVARARAGLQRLGVTRGDRVAGFLPNVPRGRGADARDRRAGRGLVVVLAGLRRGGCGRPVRADHARGAARRRRLPLRRPHPQPAGQGRRRRRRHPRAARTSWSWTSPAWPRSRSPTRRLRRPAGRRRRRRCSSSRCRSTTRCS